MINLSRRHNDNSISLSCYYIKFGNCTSERHKQENKDWKVLKNYAVFIDWFSGFRNVDTLIH